MAYGALGAQLACIVALLVLAVVRITIGTSSSLIEDLNHGTRAMLWIYLPFAAIILVCLTLRGFPSVDLRSATSVMVLGPLTALRPLVMATGVCNALLHMSYAASKALAIFVLVLMFLTEIMLNRIADGRDATVN